MLKRLTNFSIFILAVFFVGSGIYFYNKTATRKIVAEKNIVPVNYDAESLITNKEYFYDFESANKNTGSPLDPSFAGNKNLHVTKDMEFAAETVVKFGQIPNIDYFREVEIEGKILNKINNGSISWVFQTDSSNGKLLYWEEKEINAENNKWVSFKFRFKVDVRLLNTTNSFKTYVWNKSQNIFDLDDVHVRLLNISNEHFHDLYSSALNPSTYFFDLEDDSLLEKTKSLTDKFSHSGKVSSLMDGRKEYSVRINLPVNKVVNDTLKIITASVWLYSEEKNINSTLCFEVRTESNDQLCWFGKNTGRLNLGPDKWHKLNASFTIPEEVYSTIRGNDRIFIYVLNNERSKTYADDFLISFGDNYTSRGSRTYVDMNSGEGAAYRFSEKHPPHPVLPSYYVPILNNSGLSPNEGVNPFRPLMTGNFTGSGNGRDELLVINETSFDLFSYCRDKKQFLKLGKSTAHNFPPMAQFVSGNFTGDDKKELLVIVNSDIQLFSFNGRGLNPCVTNSGEFELKKISSQNLEIDLARVLSGKFSGNRTDEIFVCGRNGVCSYFKYKNNAWERIATTILHTDLFNEQSTQTTGYFTSSDKEKLISVYKDSIYNKCVLLELSNNDIKTIHYSANAIRYTLEPSDKLFPITLGGKNNFLLAFNNSWRNELRLVRFSENNPGVFAVPTFKGYLPDQNPLFYEYMKIVPGKFSSTETELLIILRNCADSDFNGYSCKSYENIPGLPNTIQLYKFQQ